MAGKLKTLFDTAKKLEKGASRRVGALGNKDVRIEPGSKVGSAVGGIKDPKTGRVLKKDKIEELTSKGRRRIAGTGVAGAAAATLSGGSDDKPKKKDFTKGVSRGGVPFKEAFRKARKDGKKTFEWNDKEYTTDLASEKKKDTPSKSNSKTTTDNKKQGVIFGKGAKFRPFGGVLARALLGDDEKFGGERGAIDFIRTKKKKPVGKNQGGMMKKKGYKRGGAVGMSKPGKELPIAGKNPPKLSSSQQSLLRQAQAYANQTGQNPAEVKRLTSMYGDLNAAKDAKKARRQAGARGTGPRRMKMGGMSMKSKMASKGGKMGGMMPPGYKNGGSVGRKKARGVGAAKRGFGKAMR